MKQPTHTPRCQYAKNTPHQCDRPSVIAIQELGGPRRVIPFCQEHFAVFAEDFATLLRQNGLVS